MKKMYDCDGCEVMSLTNKERWSMVGCTVLPPLLLSILLWAFSLLEIVSGLVILFGCLWVIDVFAPIVRLMYKQAIMTSHRRLWRR